MSWAGFWLVFLGLSLAVYAVVALAVTIRGGAELVTLIRTRGGGSREPDGPEGNSDVSSRGRAGDRSGD
ncbi:MAG: hypothetical protein DWQ36_21315 [Acidobacteria bacterium]|mgnify:CR=1 FL=1|nr:MAG: hypothetical protein DWQ30_09735 [Acidobacteriota bacterium]REK01048.1 MAG: hypothetical protein DWQ36_21315 [Acidobacteriota bacterium]